MHVPSYEMSLAISAEDNCIWFLDDPDESSITIIVKTSSGKIESIVKGCPVELLIGAVKTGKYECLVTGLKVFDLSDSPFTIFNTQRTPEGHTALAKFTEKRIAEISFFNEISKCIASCECSISNTPTNGPFKLSASLGIATGHSIDRLLDVFEDKIYNEIDSPNLNIKNYPLKLENWKTILNLTYFKPKYSKKSEITQKDHGLMQENLIFELLYKMYPKNTYHGPLLPSVDNRELIDILVDTPSFYLLIESKSVGITENPSTQFRRTASIKRHNKKAIGQLEGAIKSLKKGLPVVDDQGNSIDLDYDKPIHAVVLAPEINFSDEVDHMLDDAKNIYNKLDAYIHIIDVPELANIIKISREDNTNFENILVDRFFLCLEKRTLNVRHKDSSLPWVTR